MNPEVRDPTRMTSACARLLCDGLELLEQLDDCDYGFPSKCAAKSVMAGSDQRWLESWASWPATLFITTR